MTCGRYDVTNSNSAWDAITGQEVPGSFVGTKITCPSFSTVCSGVGNEGFECYSSKHSFVAGYSHSFDSLKGFEEKCLDCKKKDYRHTTILFNTFIFCQFFNEYTARKLYDEWNMFDGVRNNKMFLFVGIIQLGLQILLVQFGDEFMKTSPLNLIQWLVSIALGMCIIYNLQSIYIQYVYFV